MYSNFNNLNHDLHTPHPILTTVDYHQDVMDLLLVTQYFDMLKEVGLNGKQQNTVIYLFGNYINNKILVLSTYHITKPPTQYSTLPHSINTL